MADAAAAGTTLPRCGNGATLSKKERPEEEEGGKDKKVSEGGLEPP